MNELCKVIKSMVLPNFANMEAAIRTYDRNAMCCGAPVWRFVYHAIHSADKWFFNPAEYEEPVFHEIGMDNPFTPCSIEITDEQLMQYLEQVKIKTCGYIDSLTDEMLAQKPVNCPYTRIELVLRQFRHLSFHTGMIDQQTCDCTGEFPSYVSEIKD